MGGGQNAESGVYVATDKIIIPSYFFARLVINRTSSYLIKCNHSEWLHRWGQIIHESENASWDGGYEGETVQQGVYMYKFQTQAESGRKETIYGLVNVIR